MERSQLLKCRRITRILILCSSGFCPTPRTVLFWLLHVLAIRTRMHSSRMHAASLLTVSHGICKGVHACHAHHLPCIPTTMHAPCHVCPLQCTPPCHTCPLVVHSPCHAHPLLHTTPLPHMPSAMHAPCHTCLPAIHTP